MKNLYLKRWEEYTPLLFLQKGCKKKKLIKADNIVSGTEYNNLVDQFKMDYIFNLDKVIFNTGFGKATVLGKGLIERLDALRGIVVYKNTAPKNLSIPELRKNTFILLNRSYFNGRSQELARLKRSMNTYGLSSRTQIVFVDVNLEEVFSQDPLKNTLGDYNEEVQKNLSSEFLKSLNISEVVNETVDIEEGIEVINEGEVNESDILNSYQGYSVGDNITISERPSVWSSAMSQNNPFDTNLTFPIQLTIARIGEGLGHIAISAGGFGWDLDNLIERSLISHTPESVEEEVPEMPEILTEEERQSIVEHISEVLGEEDLEEILYN